MPLNYDDLWSQNSLSSTALLCSTALLHLFQFFSLCCSSLFYCSSLCSTTLLCSTALISMFYSSSLCDLLMFSLCSTALLFFYCPSLFFHCPSLFVLLLLCSSALLFVLLLCQARGGEVNKPHTLQYTNICLHYLCFLKHKCFFFKYEVLISFTDSFILLER